ncbi:MAG: electron transfer flavoprotein subunit beta/FixA family protein [Candidatus Hodarchaeota archaeon]
MKIIVCIKQVPSGEVKINPETGTLIREGVQSILNPFCEYALDEAIRIKKEQEEGRRGKVEVIVLTMGPPQARSALLRCLELGADRAILLCDRKFAGADTLATSLALSEAIQKFEKDFVLVFTGKQAIDGDTAQVGPELAEHLGIPQITYATSTTLIPERKRIQVKRETENGYDIVECKLPALISVSTGSNIRRILSFTEIINARKKAIKTVTADELSKETEKFGLSGSPTQVAKVFPPKSRTGGQKIESDDPEVAVDRLIVFLQENGFVEKE